MLDMGFQSFTLFQAPKNDNAENTDFKIKKLRNA